MFGYTDRPLMSGLRQISVRNDTLISFENSNLSDLVCCWAFFLKLSASFFRVFSQGLESKTERLNDQVDPESRKAVASHARHVGPKYLSDASDAHSQGH